MYIKAKQLFAAFPEYLSPVLELVSGRDEDELIKLAFSWRLAFQTIELVRENADTLANYLRKTGYKINAPILYSFTLTVYDSLYKGCSARIDLPKLQGACSEFISELLCANQGEVVVFSTMSPRELMYCAPHVLVADLLECSNTAPFWYRAKTLSLVTLFIANTDRKSDKYAAWLKTQAEDWAVLKQPKQRKRVADSVDGSPSSSAKKDVVELGGSSAFSTSQYSLQADPMLLSQFARSPQDQIAIERNVLTTSLQPPNSNLQQEPYQDEYLQRRYQTYQWAQPQYQQLYYVDYQPQKRSSPLARQIPLSVQPSTQIQPMNSMSSQKYSSMLSAENDLDMVNVKQFLVDEYYYTQQLMHNIGSAIRRKKQVEITGLKEQLKVQMSAGLYQVKLMQSSVAAARRQVVQLQYNVEGLLNQRYQMVQQMKKQRVRQLVGTLLKLKDRLGQRMAQFGIE